MILREEIELHRKIEIDTKDRFDINRCYSNWLREFYHLFDKPAPDQLKKQIKKTIVLWTKDEHLLFRILANDFMKEEYECPKCKHKAAFIPARYKKIEKLLKEEKPVRAEKPRTLSCQNCSFSFNPLKVGFYRNIRIDLRK